MGEDGLRFLSSIRMEENTQNHQANQHQQSDEEEEVEDKIPNCKRKRHPRTKTTKRQRMKEKIGSYTHRNHSIEGTFVIR